jgi:hypothetical protein
MPRLRTLEKAPGELFQGKQVNEVNRPEGRPEFVPGEAVAEAAKLKKFSDAGRTQIQWLPDVGRADF